MPTYQYACTECGDRLEVVQRFSDDPLTVCAACGGKLRKVFSPVGIVFKGSGFYRTDSRSGEASSGGIGQRQVRRRRLAGVRRRAPIPARRPIPGRRPARTRRRPRRLLQRVVVQRVVRRVVVRRDGSKGSKSARLLGNELEGRLSRGERAGQHRRHRRVRFLRVPGRRDRGRRRHPVRAAERRAHDRDGRPGGRWRSCPGTARDHRFPPHRIPYLANLWALRSVGVRQVLAPERGRLADRAARSGHAGHPRPDRRPDLGPGRRRTTPRAARCTSQFADPYCPAGRPAAVAAARGIRLGPGHRRGRWS